MNRAAADLRNRASRLLRDEPMNWNRGDDDMNAKARMIPEGMVTRPAAVLVPVIARPEGLTVLLTQRTERLSQHPGQIAFPGGRIDTGETALEAALREAEEEIALAREFVEPLGFLDGYLTVTGYLVKPVVALVRDDHTIEPHAAEVADAFEVPFEFLMNPANRRIDSREFRGLERKYYVYPYENRYIWGATAGMLKNLHDRLFGTP